MALRKTRRALQEGSVRFCSQGDVFLMERRKDGERLVTAINNTGAPQTCTLCAKGAKDLLGGSSYKGEGKGEALSLKVPPFTSMILELE